MEVYTENNQTQQQRPSDKPLAPSPLHLPQGEVLTDHICIHRFPPLGGLFNIL